MGVDTCFGYWKSWRWLAVVSDAVPLGLLLWYFAAVGLFVAIEVPHLGMAWTEYLSRGFANVPPLVDHCA